MSNKKNRIQVKLELKDELKTLVETEAESEFRSCTQQIYYILNKYYKEGFGTKNIQRVEENEQKIINNEYNELKRTNSEYNELKVTNNEYEYTNSYNEAPISNINSQIVDENEDEYEDDIYEGIDPEMLDF